MANMPVMERDSSTASTTTGKLLNFRWACLHFGARQGINTIWYLQNRMSPHSKIGPTAKRLLSSVYFTPCVQTYHGSPFARIGRGTQCDSWLARTCQSGDHQSLCRNQPPYETKGFGNLPTTVFCYFRGIPTKTNLACRCNAAQVAEIHLDFMCSSSRAPPTKNGG